MKEEEKNDKAVHTLDNKEINNINSCSSRHIYDGPGTVTSTLPMLSQCLHSSSLRWVPKQPHLKEKPPMIREGKKLAQGHTAREAAVQFGLKPRQSGSIACMFHHLLSHAVAQSCPTLCDPTDCSLPGSPVHGTFQVRILEWIAISSSRGPSQPMDQTHLFCISKQIL